MGALFRVTARVIEQESAEVIVGAGCHQTVVELVAGNEPEKTGGLTPPKDRT